MKFQNAKILVAILDYPFLETECVNSIFSMIEYSKWECPGESYPRNEIGWMFCNGTSPARAHNKAISAFLDDPSGFRSLLIVGRDHIFRPDALRLLYEADKDIIAGITTVRLKSFADLKTPIYSVVSGYKEGKITTLTKLECLKKIRDEKYQPFKVPAIGDGLMLIKRKVFERMPAPWFYEPPMDEDKVKPGKRRGLWGCDIIFCNRARELGFEIWAHPEVQYVHIGRSYTFVEYP